MTEDATYGSYMSNYFGTALDSREGGRLEADVTSYLVSGIAESFNFVASSIFVGSKQVLGPRTSENITKS